jgi:endonuclease/exonuclease/phosphatase family metal-dependent hydrolase
MLRLRLLLRLNRKAMGPSVRQATFQPVVRLARTAALVALAAACATLRPAAETTLRVMTYNIQSGGGNLDATAAIRAQSPDVVGLQEVDVHWAERSGFADQASALGARLGMTVRFAHIYALSADAAGGPAREFGVALLSRYRVTSWRNDTLTRLSTQVPNATPAPAPGLLEATLDVRGTPVRVFVTHLDYRADPAVRATQAAEMAAYLDARPAEPTLVLGDLNATPDAPELRPLLARLRAVPAPAPTYPAESPTKRIDYVLVSPHFRVRRASVPDTRASDHRPVVAELVLRAARP